MSTHKPLHVDEARLDLPGLTTPDPSDPHWVHTSAEVLRQTAASGAQMREALALSQETDIALLSEEGRPRAVVVAGVGTAARTGEVLAAVAGTRAKLPVLAHRMSGIPAWVGASDVVIAVSASGRGPEALAAATAAAARGARLVAVGAADSELHAVATQARAVFVPVPPRRPARINFWALAVPVLLAGRAIGLVDITETDLAETATRLDADATRCRPSADLVTNEGKSLALALAESIPVIWGSTWLAAVAGARFVDQLATNARYPATSGALGEASRGRIGVLDGVYGQHGYTEEDFFADRLDENGATRLRLVLLHDEGASDEEKRRANIVESIARERHVPLTVVSAQGVSPLERLASLIAVPDFASIYLAALHGIDPVAVSSVTELKESMSVQELAV